MRTEKFKINSPEGKSILQELNIKPKETTVIIIGDEQVSITQDTSYHPDPLSPRQSEVLLLTAHGNPVKRIAELMGISTQTVELHRVNINKALGAKNAPHAVYLAMQRKII